MSAGPSSSIGATEGRITVGDGVELAYRFDGHEGAPVLVLSHSLGTSMALFAPVVRPLAKTFRVLRYDARGHGRSSIRPGGYALDRLALDVIELLDGLALEKVHFGGVSLGGAVGQAVAVRAPERIDRLILANTAAHFGPPSGWQDRIELVRAEGMGAVVDGVVERGLTAGFIARAKDTVDVLRHLVAGSSPDGYIGTCAALRDADQRRTCALITAPTLVIAGLYDPSTPIPTARFLRDHIRNPDTGARSNYIELETAHLSCLEAPKPFASAVSDFLS